MSYFVLTPTLSLLGGLLGPTVDEFDDFVKLLELNVEFVPQKTNK